MGSCFYKTNFQEKNLLIFMILVKKLDYDSLKEYILKVKKKKYDFIVFQKFMKKFFHSSSS